MSAKLITAAHMQAQARRIKSVLEQVGGWKLEGTTAQIAYKYKNADRDELKLQGVKSIDGIILNEKSVTIDSASIDSDTQIIISGAGYEFTLADTINAQVVSPNTKITAEAAQSSVYLTAEAAQSSVYSDGNCYIENAAPSVKIIGNFGNDTVLNTGAGLAVSTGGSSSIADYSPRTSTFYYYADEARGNADTIYVDAASMKLHYHHTAPLLFFGDNASGNNLISTGSIDRAYIKRAKNMLISLGGGKDSVTIGNDVENCTIDGGIGADYITIDSGSKGNVYIYDAESGSDSIFGWNRDKDTLQLGSAIQSSYLSTDGDILNIQIASSYSPTVKICGLGLSEGSDTLPAKINILNEQGVMAQTVIAPCSMLGTAAAESSYLDRRYNGYTVNAGGGNDSITINGASNISVDAGAGNDCITVTGGSKDCTIIGGAGYDSIYIDNSSGIYVDAGTSIDCITVTGNSKDCTIIGGAAADSIFIENSSGIYVDADGSNDFITVTGGSKDCTILGGKNSVLADNASNIYVEKGVITINNSNGVYIKDGSSILVANSNGVYAGGSSGNNRITVTSGSKDCTVDCGAGNDSVFVDNASGVFVDGGISGASYVSVMSGADKCTVYGGGGANIGVRANNSSGNLYSITSGSKYASVWGFKAEDTILIDGESYTQNLNSGINYLYYEGNTSKKILLKGALLEGKTALTSVASDYASLEGGFKINVSVKSGDKYVDKSARAIILGTAGADTINITLDNAVASLGAGNDSVTVSGSYCSIKNNGGTNNFLLESTADHCTILNEAGTEYVTVGGSYCLIDGSGGYNAVLLESTADYCTVTGGKGKDSVTVSSSNCFINAGASIDAIYINAPASNCTIFGGAANDSIFNNSNGNVFYYTGSTGEGTDSLTAFNSNDLFYIADSDCAVTDSLVSGNARLQFTTATESATVNTYCVLIGKTTGDTVRIKLGAEGAVQTYTIGTGF